MILNSLYISSTKEMGRGIFTSAAIGKDVIVETSPVVVMSKEERLLLDKTLLHDYIFEWGENNDQCCMALGYIAVYNHSYNSNCEYEMNFSDGTISIKTMRPINEGEELFINYNGDYNDEASVWFETK